MEHNSASLKITRCQGKNVTDHIDGFKFNEVESTSYILVESNAGTNHVF